MTKSTKNTRKTNTSRASKSPTRATSKKSKKTNGVVFGRLMPKQRSHWAILIVVVVLVGAIGSWLLYNSYANTYGLSPEGCKIRGRVGEFNEAVGKYYCYSACRSYAGNLVANPDGYGYCSHAITAASTMSQTKCSSLGRKWVGTVGCARVWMQAAYPDKKVFYNALQCAKDGADYHVTNTYDYCGSGSSLPSGSIIVGSMSPVGGSYQGADNCVSFIKWVLDHHSSKYAGGPLGDGGTVAGHLHGSYGGTTYNYPSKRAPHAVVSMPNGDGGWSPGHVALVDAVRSDGSIVVEESNWNDFNGHPWSSGRVIPASVAKNLVYAYITDWE
jgi:hypothetical protein